MFERGDPIHIDAQTRRLGDLGAVFAPAEDCCHDDCRRHVSIDMLHAHRQRHAADRLIGPEAGRAAL
jgi:hypothetical protein